MRPLLLVMLGGALGSGLRWVVAQQCAERGWDRLPWQTLCVNTAGSFLLGVVAVLAGDAARMSDSMRLFLAAGVLGGFTTYSSFNEEVLRMMRGGAGGKALLYAALTVCGCLAAGMLGHWLAASATRAS